MLDQTHSAHRKWTIDRTTNRPINELTNPTALTRQPVTISPIEKLCRSFCPIQQICRQVFIMNLVLVFQYHGVGTEIGHRSLSTGSFHRNWTISSTAYISRGLLLMRKLQSTRNLPHSTAPQWCTDGGIVPANLPTFWQFQEEICLGEETACTFNRNFAENSSNSQFQNFHSNRQ